LIEKKSAQVLVVIRETYSEDAVPDEDALHCATLEATHREIEGLIGTMRSARPADPLRQKVIAQLADDAEASLIQRRLAGPYPTEEQLVEFAKGATESFRRLTEMVHNARKGNAGEPPTPREEDEG
jgi:hypothetical protein